jgi:glycosyltransferase involved in cell wall biosynthesis
MKILQLVCVYPPYGGGMGTVAKNFHKAVIESGHESFVIYPGYKKNKQIDLGGEVRVLKPFVKLGNGASLPQVTKHLPFYDIVHLHYPFYGTAEMVWLAKVILKQKFCLVIHFHMQVTGLPFYFKVLKIPDTLIRSSLWKSAQAVSVASLDYVQNLSEQKELYNKYGHKYFEIPFGVDTKTFYPKTKENDVLKILFVGGMDRPHYFKGIPILFQALNRIKDLNWLIDLVGKGELKNDYKKLAVKFGIEKKVKFLELDDIELIEKYQESSLLILPSINMNEAFGLVLLEAMASGMAVIASRLPGVRKVFTDKEEGYYFEPKNADELARKIKELIERPDILKNMSTCARQTAINKYENKIIAKKLISFYENLLNK